MAHWERGKSEERVSKKLPGAENAESTLGWVLPDSACHESFSFGQINDKGRHIYIFKSVFQQCPLKSFGNQSSR